MSDLRREDVQDIYPLTPMQAGMLFHGVSGDRSEELIPYLIEMTFRIDGELDAARFEESWNRLLARHEILRAVFNASAADQPVAIVPRQRRLRVERIDISHLADDEQRRAIEAHRRRERTTPFNLGRDLLMRVTLFQLGPRSHQVVWVFHHILMDGWCTNVVQRELFDVYGALAAGREPVLPPVASYRDYIRALQRQDMRASLDFWSGRLEGFETPVSPAGIRAGGAPSGELQHCPIELDEPASAALRRLAASRNATLNHLFRAVWALLLARDNNAPDVVFGTVVSGRMEDVPGIAEMIGLCINTIPVRLRVDDDATLVSLIDAARDDALAAHAHEHCSLAEVQARSAPKRALLDHLLLFESYPTDVRFEGPSFEPLPGLRVSGIDVSTPNHYGFQIAVFPNERLRIVLTGRSPYTRATLERLARRLGRAIDAMIANPNQLVGDVELLSRDEQLELLGDVTAPARTNETLAARVERLLAEPQQPYAVDDMTWSELGARSARLAGAIADCAGGRVALFLPASRDFVVAVVAAMRCGATFVPVDPANPASRSERILDDCGAAAIVTTRDLAASLPKTNAPLVFIDDEREPAAPFVPRPELASGYILYTSGTTGMPKGVIVPGAALLNYTDWLARRMAIGAGDASVLLSSHAFDLGYTALFGALLNGGRIDLASESTRRDAEAIVELCVDRRLTFLKITPAQLHLLVSAANAARLAESSLRIVFIGGDTWPVDDVAAFRRLAPHVELRNHYGPTESCIGCISGSLDLSNPDVAAGRQRLGMPIDGMRAYVVDARLRPVPRGIAGELVVAGAGLADGYTNGDSQRFVRAPWAGLRLYRTGDRASIAADGAFLFHGRADDQVKVRGYRVEPAEIEAALRRVPPIEAAVVLPLPSRSGERELVAFVTGAGDALDVVSIRASLAAVLPEYMIPAQFVSVSHFPLTGNGKIDRRALAEHQRTARTATGRAIATATERTVRDVWQSVLGIDGIGADDDFFALGGHSLKAILALSRLRKALGVKLDVRDFFDNPTVRRLARRIDDGAGARAPMIALRDGDSGAPRIFFLPPAIGTSTLYRELVEALDSGAGASGLQCPGFDSDEPFHDSLASMAASFAAQIRRLQPQGPYLLCGYSMGVAVAIEIASRIEAAGESASLILVDGVAGGGGAWPETIDALHGQQHWAHVLAILEQNLERADRERIERLAAHNVSLLRAHRSTASLSGDVVCIEAGDNDRRAGMDALRGITRGRFVHVVTPGNHYTMFHPPHFRRFLDHFTDAVLALSRDATGAQSTHG